MVTSRPIAEDGSLERLSIDTIRTLAMDAVQKANSGHPGTPMALAPVAYTLWTPFMRYDPDMPDWPNRDRFVLSIGHVSMLLYAALHLAGVKEVDPDGKDALSLEDINQFRQLGSKTPGHPEYRITTGVETTTGPLGQGAVTRSGWWCRTSRTWVLVATPASNASSTACSTTCSSWCKTNDTISTISLSPPSRLSRCPCNCRNASGISRNAAPLRNAPGLR